MLLCDQDHALVDFNISNCNERSRYIYLVLRLALPKLVNVYCDKKLLVYCVINYNSFTNLKIRI